MNLAELSVKRPVFISCLFLATLVLGILAYSRLSSSLYPDVTFPVMTVVVPFPGAGPTEIEAQVATPLETELNSLAGIRLVKSLSFDGAAAVTAVFTMDTDIRFAEQKVIQAVTRVRPNLPSGVLEPIVRSVDPNETPVATLVLTADLSESQLFELADRDIRPAIEQVPQVGLVTVVGARQREIQVDLNLPKLKQLQMSVSEVSQRLTSQGVNVPAGQISDAKSETLVRSVGQFDSLDALRAAPIRSMGGQVITLGDVAAVKDGLTKEKNRVSISGAASGSKALVLRVFRRTGANIIESSDSVRARVDDISKGQGAKIKGFQLEILREGSKPVREGLKDATEAILFGLVLTIIVVFFFLGNIRSTVITGLALPNSLLGAFFLMWMAGFSINITTLAALALAIGLLIDDAIVVRENIYRRMEVGDSPQVAAVRGTREVTLAVVATTLTVLAVFGPVSFLQGLIGQFFKQFGLTICFAMMISLLDSLTVAPMLSAYFGHAASETQGLVQKIVAPFNRFQDALGRLYNRCLDVSLRYPLSTLGIAVLICGLSVVILQFIPKEFIPPNETGEFRVVFDLPAGVSLQATDEKLKSAMDLILKHSEVRKALSTAGGENGELNHGEILVLLKPSSERSLRTSEFKEIVRQDLKSLSGSEIRVEDLFDVGGDQGHPYTVKISGDNLDEVHTAATQLVEHLQKGNELKDVAQSYRPGTKEIRWTIDTDKAHHSGVASGEAGYELRLLLSGSQPANYHDGGRQYPVHVRYDLGSESPDKFFDQVQVPDLNHRMIPLTSIAKRTLVEAPAAIPHENRKPAIEVDAEVNRSGKGLSAALTETSRLFDSGEIKLPPGVHYEFAGQTKDFQDLLTNVIIAALLSVLTMYLVLASLYESFFVPLSIMLVLPLAICGAFYALWISRSSLDIYSMIGCILLMGVAAKNSILLVDRIQSEVREGQDLAAAVKRAGEVRFRPIVMTSFALIAGMLPLALPLIIPAQESARGRAPMAVAVIGGVISSTLLTLVVVPAAYGYVIKFEGFVRRTVNKWLRAT